jgi:hypothetical protein
MASIGDENASWRFRPFSKWSSAMQTRRRFKQELTLKDRLMLWAEKVREDAEKVRPGPDRDAFLKKARLADTAAHIDDWANSPGLQLPR